MRVFVPGLFLAFSSFANALEVRCVDTATELSNAVQLAASEEVEVRIVVGTYNVTQTCLDTEPVASCDEPDHDLTIRGGYNSTCSSRSDDPGLTIITNPGRTLRFSANNGLTELNLSIDRLTFRAISVLNLELEFINTPNFDLALDRIWVDQVSETKINNDTVRISNSLFSRSGLALELGRYADSVILDNNTFVDSMTGLLCDRCMGIARNNVFWGNITDIRVNGSVGNSSEPVALALLNNTYQTIDAIDPLVSPPQGSSSANPLFVNAAAQNYRIQNTSPAVNSGTPIGLALTGNDHDGGVRWFGDLPDRGAFETSVGTTSSTITVTNVNDTGTGSLRQAILDANVASNLNRIHFNTGSTCGPRIINLATPLPTIAGPVVIDGYTQPGALRNTLSVGSNAVRCIGLNGQGSVLNGLATDTDDNVAVTIDGIGFGGFTLIALNLTGGNGHRVAGSQFGGEIGPSSNLVALLPSVNGLQVGSLFGGGAAAGVDIGGSDAGERNVFSDSTDAAIRIGSGANNANIVNNYIGVGVSGGSGTEANRDGIVVGGRFTNIRGNTISNNSRHGILVTGAQGRATFIRDNRIGITASCLPLGCGTTFGNGEDGIRFQASSSDAVIEDNQIRFNGDDGVVITDDAVRIAVLRNRITDNNEQPIDLSDDGNSQNTNNTAPVPAGSGNFRQNRPSLTSAIGQGSSSLAAGVATGSLNSSNGTYRIDFYAVVDCPLPIVFGSGSPQIWLGTAFTTISNDTANFDGQANFSGLIGVAGDLDFFATPRLIGATATRMASSDTDSQPRSTSEVSTCLSFDARLFANGFE